MRHVLRGGSWGDSPAVVVRPSNTSAYPSATEYDCFGFRVRLAGRAPR